MTTEWSPKETSTHQDHVIAHVIGAAVLGHFVFDEALHVVLDMGFIWTIYLDGQMLLLPQFVALDELEVDTEIKQAVRHDLELLSREGCQAEGLKLITKAAVECVIREVEFFERDDRRRFLVNAEAGRLVIETSLTAAQIDVAYEG